MISLSTVVNQITSSQLGQSLYHSSQTWHGYLVSLLQNRILAGVAFLVSTVIGSVLGAKIAPIVTAPATDFINRVCDRYPYMNKLLVGSVVFLSFGSVVFATNLFAAKFFRLPLSVKFSLIVTFSYPALVSLITALESTPRS